MLIVKSSALTYTWGVSRQVQKRLAGMQAFLQWEG